MRKKHWKQIVNNNSDGPNKTAREQVREDWKRHRLKELTYKIYGAIICIIAEATWDDFHTCDLPCEVSEEWYNQNHVIKNHVR